MAFSARELPVTEAVEESSVSSGVAIVDQPEKESVFGTPSHFMLAGFALFNLILFEILLQTDLYSISGGRLRSLFTVVTVTLSIVLLVFCCAPLFRAALSEITRGHLTYRVNIALALAFSGFYALFGLVFDFEQLGSLPLSSSFIVIVFLLLLKEPLERAIFKRIERSSDVRLSSSVRQIRLIAKPADDSGERGNTGETPEVDQVWVEVERANPGDLYQVLTGEVIPCDGIIEQGNCEVREKRISGFERTRVKGKGDEVFAGSTVIQGEVTCRVTERFEDSRVTSMEGLLQESRGDLSAVAARSEYAEKILCGVILIIALLGGEFLYLYGAPIGSVFSFVVSALLLSCLPAVLRLIPDLYQLATASCYNHGILLRSAADLELLREIESVILDSPTDADEASATFSGAFGEVRQFDLLDDRIERKGLLAALGTLLGRADDETYAMIGEYCRGERGVSVELCNIASFNFYGRAGISGVMHGAEFTVGNEELLIERGVQIQSSEVREDTREHQFVYVAIGEEVVARFEIRRSEAAARKGVLVELRALGVRPVLLGSGDEKQVDLIGKELGFELADVFGGLSEAEYQRKLQVLHPALFFANDTTDTSRIEHADISLSVFNELHWDAGRSDITLFQSDPALVPWTIRLARQIHRVRWGNIALASVFTGFLLIGALFAVIGPVHVLLAMMACSALVFLNTRRLT